MIFTTEIHITYLSLRWEPQTPKRKPYLILGAAGSAGHKGSCQFAAWWIRRLIRGCLWRIGANIMRFIQRTDQF